MTATHTDALLSEYTEGAENWDLLVGNDAQHANRTFDRLHVIAKELRQTPAGRDGLTKLLDHELVGVRLLAATECLAWSPAEAVPVLEAIAMTDGLHAISAKYTLKSYRAGTLNLNW